MREPRPQRPIGPSVIGPESSVNQINRGAVNRMHSFVRDPRSIADRLTAEDFFNQLIVPKMDRLKSAAPAIVFLIDRVRGADIETAEAKLEYYLESYTGADEENKKAMMENFKAFLADLRDYAAVEKISEQKLDKMVGPYKKWLDAQAKEAAAGERETEDMSETGLARRFKRAYIEYLQELYGDDFRNLTNKALEESQVVFTEPTRELRASRTEERAVQGAGIKVEKRKKAGPGAFARNMTPAAFAELARQERAGYFDSEANEGNLPYLYPTQKFYEISQSCKQGDVLCLTKAYKKQRDIIVKLESKGFLVRERLNKIYFPATEADKENPKDVLWRIDPKLRDLANADIDKIEEFIDYAENRSEIVINGQRTTLKAIALQNTDHRAEMLIIPGEVGGYDLAKIQDFRKATNQLSIRHHDDFLDTDITKRLLDLAKEQMIGRADEIYGKISAEFFGSLKERRTNVRSTMAELIVRQYPDSDYIPAVIEAAVPFVWSRIREQVWNFLEAKVIELLETGNITATHARKELNDLRIQLHSGRIQTDIEHLYFAIYPLDFKNYCLNAVNIMRGQALPSVNNNWRRRDEERLEEVRGRMSQAA
jgi:hypothetical protein